MKGLTAPQRQSVALAFFDGLSHAEIAEHLHQPLGTVKTRIRSAMMQLRERLLPLNAPLPAKENSR